MKIEMALSIPDHVIAREVSGDTVLLDLNTGTYFGLDQIGARIWALLSEGKTIAEVCDVIHTEYDADRATIETDVSDLCEHLLQNNLVEQAA